MRERERVITRGRRGSIYIYSHSQPVAPHHTAIGVIGCELRERLTAVSRLSFFVQFCTSVLHKKEINSAQKKEEKTLDEAAARSLILLRKFLLLLPLQILDPRD